MANADVNWKLKYQELKAKFMSSVDTAFRLGFEQGAQQAQVQSAQDQLAQQQQADQQAQQGQPDEGQPQEGGQPEQQAQPESAHPDGSELDQYINELSSMLGKSEITGEDLLSLKKSFGSLKASVESAKAQKAISSIAKSLKLSKTSLTPIKHAGAENLTPVAKKALSMQEQIVENMMSTWAEQESDSKKSILDIIKKD